MARGGVSFELERFGWAEGTSVLELAGRWRGPRRRRLGAVTLVLPAGERRRLAPAATTGEARADPEPELWRAEFIWSGVVAGGAELDVGGSLVIELPAPTGRAAHHGAPARDPARAELEVAHRQIEADRKESARLRGELTTLRRDAAELERAQAAFKAAQATAEAERESARQAREELAAARGEAEKHARQAQEAVASARLAGGAAEEATTRERALAERAAERERVLAEEAAERERVLAEQAAERERALTAERDAAQEQVRRLRTELDALPTVAATPEPARPRSNPPETREQDVPAVRAPLAEPDPPLPPGTGAFRQDPEAEATDTLVLDAPRRRGRPQPQRRERERLTVTPHRTATVPRRLAQPPPHDSAALRAIAAVLLLLLAVVMVVVLVSVV